MKFGQIFDDPDMCDSVPYQAIYDMIIDQVYKGRVPPSDRELTEDELGDIESVITEFEREVRHIRKAIKEHTHVG